MVDGDRSLAVAESGAPVVGATVAVIVPCHNEETTVADVVKEFSAALPGATVYVFDNRSTDDTARIAGAAGAVVVPALRPGKGSVVRKMFSDVEADSYLMVDGDGTYDVEVAAQMLARLHGESLDMVVGARVPSDRSGGEYPSGHAVGNRFFSMLYSTMFDVPVSDAFSGYRAMSRRFVKSFPATTSGFDIETELLAHAAELKLEVVEVPTRYYARPEGSESKLATYRDGVKILLSALRLLTNLHPKRVFGIAALLLTAAALMLGLPVVEEFRETGLVERFPTAILAASLQIVALILATSGIIISAIRQLSREQRRLAYLAVSPTPTPSVDP